MKSFSKPMPFNLDEFAGQLWNTDDFDLHLMTATVGVAQIELTHLYKLNKELLQVIKQEEINRAH